MSLLQLETQRTGDAGPGFTLEIKHGRADTSKKLEESNNATDEPKTHLLSGKQLTGSSC